jgi:hypothetical protein
VVAVVVLIFATGSGGTVDRMPRSSRTVSVATAELPGAQTNNGSWDNGAGRQLQQRLRALDLPLLTAEGSVLHIH